MEQKDDIYYIKKVIDGQSNYFSYLVERYRDIVFSIALKILRNKEDAEEMAQESFIKAYKSLHSFKGGAKFSTWLYRIAYNTCISEVRKRKIQFISTEDVVIKEEAQEMNLDEIPEEKRGKAIKEAMHQLPENEYTLILLHYFKEQSIEEISRITQLSANNVKVKLFRARKKLYTILHKIMKEEIYTLS